MVAELSRTEMSRWTENTATQTATRASMTSGALSVYLLCRVLGNTDKKPDHAFLT
jgi:hypothetical protein